MRRTSVWLMEALVSTAGAATVDALGYRSWKDRSEHVHLGCPMPEGDHGDVTNTEFIPLSLGYRF